MDGVTAVPSDGWFRARAEAAGVVFYVIRSQPDVAVEFVSDAIEDHLGYSAAELNADPQLLARLVDPRDTEKLGDLLRTAPGESASVELRWVHRSGRTVWTEHDVTAVGRPDGSVTVEGTGHLVTSLREAQQSLAASEERYRLLAENAYDVIWTMALDGTITYVSPSVERVRGITPQEAAAQTLDQIHPADSAARVMEYYGRLYAAIEEGTELPTFHGVQEYYRKDGSIMTGELQVVPQVDADGHVITILGVTRDISERTRAEAELNRLAVTDPLTGVWNRRHGEELFAADLAEARRYGPSLAMLMFDIDHFKQINDAGGHQAGDHVLVEITRRLSAVLRGSDTLVRWGGDEFVIVMRHCTLAEAESLAERIRVIVADTPFRDVGTVTVSMGAAELLPEDDLASWVHRADQAMYAAKQAGRNAVRSA